MAGGRKFRLPRPQGFVLWASVTGLLFLGVLTTLVDLIQLPVEQRTYANIHLQRFVVNATTGEVLLGVGTPKSDEDVEFDVSTPEETPPPAEKPDVSDAPVTTEPPATTAAPEPEPEPLTSGLPALRQEPMTFKLAMPPHTKDSLVSAPAPEITETIDGASLPKRGDKGTTAASLYAHPFKRKPDQILVSFVVLNVGVDPQSIGLAMALPAQVSVAYSPYTRAETSYSEALRAVGHEVWTMLPVMGERYPSDDPGPLGIIGRMPAEETVRRVRHVLGVVPGSIGMILPTDETVSLQKDTLPPALEELNKRGLLLLSTHPSRSIEQLTSDKELAEIVRRADLILDPEPDESQIRSKLSGILAAAKEKGEYVVALSSRPQTLQLLAEWLKKNPLAEPYVLAPISAIYQSKDQPIAEAEAPKDEGHGGGHGGGDGGEKKKEKPKAKKQKPLPQDKYKQPPAGEKGGGGHGGGGH